VIVHRDERRGRASSFAEVADAYERARPEYPLEAIRWLAGDEPADVVDLGAGTGKLTRGLVALGHRVVAVEPLEEMLALLRVAVPAARAVGGSAEQLPLGAASADVVACAQAFHWFDKQPALREIARVLRPGGRVALVWNTRDTRDDWTAALSETIGRETVEPRDAEGPIAESGLYGPVESAAFPYSQRLDREALLDLVRSRSYCAVMAPEERERVLGRVAALYEAQAGPGGVVLPYVTQCFRARLLSGS
jgi:SAM-dependent methyltransferase